MDCMLSGFLPRIAAQMGVEPATVTYYKKCAINKIRDEVMEDY